MKDIKIKMIKIYNITDTCWMGYKVSENNPFTYHHIIKAENGGKEEIKNGAILTLNPHQYLHIIENYDFELYIYINNLLKKINEQGTMPNLCQLRTIDELLKSFERQHCSTKNSKGKLLIKEEYYKRYIR